MKRLQLFIPIFLIGIFFFNTSSAQSAFIKIGDIKGESTDAKHKDWINLLSFSQGIASPSGGAAGATRRRGAIVMEDITIVKVLDMSTPKIIEFATMGKVIPTVILELVGSNRIPYYTITLNNVYISSVSNSGSGSERPTESVSLNFEKITWDYIDSKGAKVSASYNVVKNM